VSSRSKGFALMEVMVSLVILTIGLLGLTTTAVLVTRMIGRGQRAGAAANFAAQRLERLRTSGGPGGSGCATHTAGADTLWRGSNWTAINSWTWTGLSSQTWRVTLSVTYRTSPGQTSTQTLVTEVSCVP
jgi:prepilin-type N-terminal cleavage/methylation domain-containing protein